MINFYVYLVFLSFYLSLLLSFNERFGSKVGKSGIVTDRYVKSSIEKRRVAVEKSRFRISRVVKGKVLKIKVVKGRIIMSELMM